MKGRRVSWSVSMEYNEYKDYHENGRVQEGPDSSVATPVSGDPRGHFQESGDSRGQIQESGVGESLGKSVDKLDEEITEKDEREAGLSFYMAAFFLVAQMAGAGFLALPRAMANTGWSGMVLMIVFCISICFSGIRLGRSWVILEERWPAEYKKPSRQPYMEIANRAFGPKGRHVTLACMLIQLIGVTIVFNILIADLISDLLPSISQCQWICIAAAVLTPATWLGSPKDFWQASVLAVVATIVAVIVIIVKIILDYGPEDSIYPDPVYLNPSITSFSLGFGAFLFAFGGAAIFPSIQNDMKDRSQFTTTAILGFAVIGGMYVPVAFAGYYFLGSDVGGNILLSVKSDIYVTIAIALQIVNLLGTYVIAFNPISQTLEDILKISRNFCWQRVVLRSLVVWFEVLIALLVPDFGHILNLMGSSTVTCLTFIFPPLFYMRLVDDKSNKEWPERSIPTWQRTYLWAILAIGIVGGIIGTVSSLMAILNPESFGKSCFANFGVQNNVTKSS